MYVHERDTPFAQGMTDHYVNPVSRLRNRTTIAFIVLSNSFGNLFLAIGAKQLPGIQDGAAAILVSTLSNAWVMAGVTVLALWMYAQLNMLSWSDLSYLVPVTASGYVLTAILGVVVLHEPVSVRRWIGIGLISFGVLLVSETGPKTVHEGPRS